LKFEIVIGCKPIYLMNYDHGQTTYCLPFMSTWAHLWF